MCWKKGGKNQSNLKVKTIKEPLVVIQGVKKKSYFENLVPMKSRIRKFHVFKQL